MVTYKDKRADCSEDLNEAFNDERRHKVCLEGTLFGRGGIMGSGKSS